MTFESIVRKPQQELKTALVTELRQMGYATITKKGFTYGAGSIPVLLVAHLDTVHKDPVQTICYSSDQKILMSPQGIGRDDRAGVYMILQIIKQHRCHVLFCEDEEIGGVGAHLFAESHIRPEVNYIVELDRRGSNDAVFYDCANPEFSDFKAALDFRKNRAVLAIFLLSLQNWVLLRSISVLGTITNIPYMSTSIWMPYIKISSVSAR